MAWQPSTRRNRFSRNNFLKMGYEEACLSENMEDCTDHYEKQIQREMETVLVSACLWESTAKYDQGNNFCRTSLKYKISIRSYSLSRDHWADFRHKSSSGSKWRSGRYKRWQGCDRAVLPGCQRDLKACKNVWSRKSIAEGEKSILWKWKDLRWNFFKAAGYGRRDHSKVTEGAGDQDFWRIRN